MVNFRVIPQFIFPPVPAEKAETDRAKNMTLPKSPNHEESSREPKFRQQST
jgi:hypothetical protein